MTSRICPNCGNIVTAKDPRTKFCCKDCAYKYRRQFKEQPLRDIRLYNIYHGILSRCYKIQDADYNRYGARGINVCQEWKDSFKEFYDWSINNGYKNDLSIDRINVNGNYEPNNCRWVDSKIQANNKTNNVFINYKNKTQTIKQWADELNLSYDLIRERYRKGMSTNDIFNIPKRKAKKRVTNKIKFNGKCLSRIGWDKLLNFPRGTINNRLTRGWSIEKALSTPIDKRFSHKYKESKDN